MNFFGKKLNTLFVFVKAEGRKRYSMVKTLGDDSGDGIIYFIDVTNPVLPEAFEERPLLRPYQFDAIHAFSQRGKEKTSETAVARLHRQVKVVNFKQLFPVVLCDEINAKLQVSLNGPGASTYWERIE